MYETVEPTESELNASNKTDVRGVKKRKLAETVVLCITNQKGGVGKTTAVHNLGRVYADMGYSVLLIDNDPQGNLTDKFFDKNFLPSDLTLVRSHSKNSTPAAHALTLYKEDADCLEPCPSEDYPENLHIFGSDRLLSELTAARFEEICYTFKKNIKQVRDEGRYDIILIDCPPTLGNNVTVPMVVSDYVLIPSELEKDSVEGIQEVINTASRIQDLMNPDLKVLGIVCNKVAPNLLLSDHFYDQICDTHGELVMKAGISKTVKIPEAATFRKGIHKYQPKSKVAEQFKELAKEILNRIR